MIDPLLSLALAIYSNPGVYCCLVGSGVSRAAGIPTGWEIALDLVGKIARLTGEDSGPNPVEWYKAKFGEEPGYTSLLKGIASSQAERSRLLRTYFEPNEADRETGARLPTSAHKAIADLVATGMIRVLVTTNFDRLLELALQEVGITPTVIASPDAAHGAMPLAHSQCTIVKLHGDYIDTRLLNTPAELARYHPSVNKLLDQVLDEYGLIVCGWSAEWDEALVAALARCKSHRFSTFWAARAGRVRERAANVLRLRRAQLISIDSADSFFTQLAEKVAALRDYGQPHPLSAELAVANLKRYMDNGKEIALADLISEETERVVAAIADEHFPPTGSSAIEELVDRMRRYEGSTEILGALMCHGCFWGEDRHSGLWIRTLERIANAHDPGKGSEVLLNLKLYPALLMLYCAGMGSIFARKYKTLSSILSQPEIRDINEELPPISRLHTFAVMDIPDQMKLPGSKRPYYHRYYPALSDYLFDVLREPTKGLLPDPVDYENCFDWYEYLFFLLHIDVTFKNVASHRLWAPGGRFLYRHSMRRPGKGPPLKEQLDNEVADSGADWGLLKAGCFDGSLDRFREVKEAADGLARTLV